MMKFLLAITGLLLAEHIKMVKCEEAKALEYIWSLCELYIIVWQWSHFEYMLGLLQEMLHKFYKSKSAFRDQCMMDVQMRKFNTLWDCKLEEARD